MLRLVGNKILSHFATAHQAKEMGAARTISFDRVAAFRLPYFVCNQLIMGLMGCLKNKSKNE